MTQNPAYLDVAFDWRALTATRATMRGRKAFWASVKLTRKEMFMLEGIAAYAGEIIPHDLLRKYVYAAQHISSNALATHVHRLRRKLVPLRLRIINAKMKGFRLIDDDLAHKAATRGLRKASA